MLSKVVFPAYRLRSYTRMYNEELALLIETRNGTYILDDKSLEGETLGERRLKIADEYLYPLSDIVFTLEELIRSKSNKFIDSAGEVITYKKSKLYTIHCKEIQSITKLGNFLYLIILDGTKPTTFESFSDIGEPKYCLLVDIKGGSLVYGFTDSDVGTFKRKL